MARTVVPFQRKKQDIFNSVLNPCKLFIVCALIWSPVSIHGSILIMCISLNQLYPFIRKKLHNIIVAIGLVQVQIFDSQFCANSLQSQY